MIATSSSPPQSATRLSIDLGAVVHNGRVAQRAAGGAAVWPVVKADGYGLGAVPIAQALANAGVAEGFCVALPEEAALLRQGGITHPLVLLSGVPTGWEERAAALNVQPFLFSMDEAHRLNAAAPPGVPFPVHLKVDTGMARLGFPVDEAVEILRTLEALPGLRVVGLVSHLACADERHNPVTAQQARRFQELRSHPEIARRGLRASLANSAGLLGHPQTRFDWVRPGILLYGASPFFPLSDWRREGLAPVVHWHSQVVQVRTLEAGTPMGYGHTWRAVKPCQIAQIRVGYGDGYSRRLSNRGEVLIRGCRVPVIGRVCMDLIAVDVTPLSQQVQPGDPVTLLGQDGEAFIGIEEMAHWMETIPYEVICRHAPRAERRYPRVIHPASSPGME